MKNPQLSFLVFLSFCLFSSLNASAHARKRVEDDRRYYQIKLSAITEISEEEALKYEHSDRNLQIKRNDINQFILGNDSIHIPSGLPGIQEVTEISNEMINPPLIQKGGGLVVGSGAGGTIGESIDSARLILDGVSMVIDKLVAIGQKIVPIIQSGRPVVTNNKMVPISVIPRIDSKDPVFYEMANWSMPQSKHYRINFVNGFGSNVVTFVYSITYQYGGTYGGKGKYLTGVRVGAREIAVSWGFDLDASSELVQISNVGTDHFVVAGATLEITYTVKNVMRSMTTSVAFHVTGDGRVTKLD